MQLFAGTYAEFKAILANVVKPGLAYRVSGLNVIKVAVLSRDGDAIWDWEFATVIPTNLIDVVPESQFLTDFPGAVKVSVAIYSDSVNGNGNRVEL